MIKLMIIRDDFFPYKQIQKILLSFFNFDNTNFLFILNYFFLSLQKLIFIDKIDKYILSLFFINFLSLFSLVD